MTRAPVPALPDLSLSRQAPQHASGRPALPDSTAPPVREGRALTHARAPSPRKLGRGYGQVCVLCDTQTLSWGFVWQG